MNKELAAFQRTHTWDLVPMPPGTNLISCKWIYRIKIKSDGSFEWYKAYLVAWGFTQKYGIDYKETFAPMAKMTSIRTLIVLLLLGGGHSIRWMLKTPFWMVISLRLFICSLLLVLLLLDMYADFDELFMV